MYAAVTHSFHLKLYVCIYIVEWLANFLTCGFTSSSSSCSTSSTSSSDPSIGAGMTMCVVSHDRYFLDKVCTESMFVEYKI